MNYFKKNVVQADKDTFLKKLAVFSIGIYIIFSTVFDTVATNLSKLSSISIYFCIGCCALYILERGSFRINFIIGALVTVGVLFSVSALYTPAQDNLVNMYLYRYLASVVLVALISNTLTKREDVLRIIDCYILAGTILSLLIYYNYGFENLASSIERIDAQMGNQNVVGISCAFTVALAVYMMVTEKRKKRLLYIASVVLSVPTVMFTGSRKSLLIIIGGVLVFVFSYSKDKKLLTKLFLTVVIVVGIYLLIFYVPAFEMIKNRILSTFDVFNGVKNAETMKSDTNRMMYMKKGFGEFLKSPLWGGGFCYSYYFFGKYSHNNYIELLMNGGLFTFIAYYSMYFAAFKKALYWIKGNKNRKHFAFIFMILAALLVMDFGVVSYYKRYTLILLAMCFCNADSLKINTNEQDGEQNELTHK